MADESGTAVEVTMKDGQADIDALMERIRDVAQKRVTTPAVASPPSPPPLSVAVAEPAPSAPTLEMPTSATATLVAPSPAVAVSPVPAILREVASRSGASQPGSGEGASVTPPPVIAPPKGLTSQAEFNQYVLYSMKQMSQCLRQLQVGLVVVEDWLKGETERTARVTMENRLRTEELAGRLDAERSAPSDAGQELRFVAEELRGQFQTGLLDLERRLRAENEQRDDLLGRLSGVLTEMNGRVSELAAFSAQTERQFREERADRDRILIDNLTRVIEHHQEQTERKFRAERDEMAESFAAALRTLSAKVDALAVLPAEADVNLGGAGSEVQESAQDGEPSLNFEKDAPAGNSPQAPADGGLGADRTGHWASYGHLFSPGEKVLDLGCGRGGFVEMLRGRGADVTGVDSDPEAVALCLDRRLPVVCVDVFEYLESLPDGSLDAVFSSGLLEGVTAEQILNLAGLCKAKLKRGGMAILETLNPACPESMAGFDRGATRRQPIPAEMLGFILEQEGLGVRSFRFSTPVQGSGADDVLRVESKWGNEVQCYREYAVLALCR